MPMPLFKARRRLVAAALVVCVCLCADAAVADSADDAVARANRMAYETAIKCFIVDGIATGDQRDAGDKAKASAFESKARESFDTATKLGDALGYSGSRVNQDFGLAQAYELPKMIKDSGYYRKAAAVCKALGLL
jgi:hypothetical protein